MKKICSILLCTAILLALTACGNQGGTSEEEYLEEHGYSESPYEDESSSEYPDDYFEHPDEYYENFDEEEAFFESQQHYDTSKASGILASLGMTEEEFRAQCQPISFERYEPPYFLSVPDIVDYPTDYTGNLYYFACGWSKNGKPQPFKVYQKGTSMDGYTTYLNAYGNTYVLLFDMRDDVYSPTISQGNNIDEAYVISIGVQTIDGIDYACFQLISLTKY